MKNVFNSDTRVAAWGRLDQENKAQALAEPMDRAE